MNCTFSDSYHTDSDAVIFGDSNHNAFEIIHFVRDFISQNDYDNLILEIPEDVQADFDNGSEQEREKIINEWTRIPEATMALIEAAVDKDMDVIFADESANALGYLQMLREYAENPTESLGRASWDHRMSINESVARHLDSVPKGERTVMLYGLGHLGSTNDIDEMSEISSEVVHIYFSEHDQSRLNDVLARLYDEVDLGDDCIYLNSPESKMFSLPPSTRSNEVSR